MQMNRRNGPMQRGFKYLIRIITYYQAAKLAEHERTFIQRQCGPEHRDVVTVDGEERPASTLEAIFADTKYMDEVTKTLEIWSVF